MLKYDMPRADDDDFVQHGETMDELTVTITLSEYRRLVADNALLNQELHEQDQKFAEMEKKLKSAMDALAACKAPEWLRGLGKALSEFGKDGEEDEEENEEENEAEEENK